MKFSYFLWNSSTGICGGSAEKLDVFATDALRS